MYARINPDRLALLSLCRAANALEQVAADRTTWFFIILDLHRALYAALIAALSVFSFDSAYDHKLRTQWSEFWENSRTDLTAQPPTGNRVPSLEGLLKMAEEGLPSVQPLQLTQQQQTDILKLNEYRNDLEHVKPDSWALDTADLPRIAENVAAVFGVLFEVFKHHLELDEIDQTNSALRRLKGS
jgi:hypothetical protein